MSTPFVIICSKICAVIVITALTSIILRAKRMPNLDSFTIGYIQESPIHNINVNIDKPLDYKSTRLYADCRDSLVALGIKKREANKKTNDVFQRQVPKDISSFLKEALK